MKKPRNNALLEWKGRKLMCRNVPVAELWFSGDLKWMASVGTIVPSSGPFDSIDKATRAVNRRFKLTEVRSTT
jgi:hypothetical protein